MLPVPNTATQLHERSPAIRELDLVTLAEAVRSGEGLIVPAGSVGTVVAIWAGGSGYEVEFTEPVALATVMPAQLSTHQAFDG